MLRGIAFLVLLAARALAAQDMPAVAERLIASGSVTNPDDLFRVQLAAGRYADAAKTLAAMPPSAARVRWDIYARAKSIEGKPFDEAFAQAFRERMQTLDDKTAHRVLWSFRTPLPVLQRALDDARTRHAADVDVVKSAVAADAYTSFAPLIPALTDEDDRRRYAVEKNVAVRMPDGGIVCAMVMHRRGPRLPALLNFTIYANPENNLDEARRAAANGFAGVVGLVRGKGCSPDAPVPYERDSADAAALIDWIAAQPWSDGRTTPRTTTPRAGSASIATST